MAGFNGPNLVTDGLKFYVDAGNVQSYPGSGNDWYDIVGTSDGTLTNGPTFSSTNGGYVNLDGVDDYIATTYGITAAGSYTVMNWVKLDSYTNYDMIFGQESTLEYGIGASSGGGPNGHADLLFYSGTGSGWHSPLYFPNGTPIIGEWTHCALVTTQGNVKYYKNGSLNTSLTDSGVTGATTKKLYFGNRGEDLSWSYLDGAISSCFIYERELSAAEVLQNYDAHKGRFGL